MCIKIHFFLFFVVVYFYAIHKTKMFFLFYGFAIIHELAHIIVAFLLKVKVTEIIMLPVGVCAKFNYVESKIKEVMIASGGPLLSIMIFLTSKNKIVRGANLVIALVNLLPIYPLDGGRIIRGTAEMLLGYKRGILFSNNVSKIILLIIMIAGITFAVYLKNYTLASEDTNQTMSALKEYFKGEKIACKDKIPFSSSRKFSAIEFDDYSLYFGAPDIVLKSKVDKKIDDYVDNNIYKEVTISINKYNNLIDNNVVKGKIIINKTNIINYLIKTLKGE